MAKTRASARDTWSFDASTSREGYLCGVNVCSRSSNMIRSILERFRPGLRPQRPQAHRQVLQAARYILLFCRGYRFLLRCCYLERKLLHTFRRHLWSRFDYSPDHFGPPGGCWELWILRPYFLMGVVVFRPNRLQVREIPPSASLGCFSSGSHCFKLDT